MHQQHKRKRAGKRGKRQNANSRIPASASIAIIDLISGVEWSTESPAVAYLREQYLTKFCSEDLVPAHERRNAAIEKWKLTELVNAETNQRLRNMDPGYNIMPRVTISQFLKFARRLTSNILGPLRDDVTVGGFSGGASTSRRRQESHPALKFADEAHTTSEAATILDTLYREQPLLRQYNVFTTLREAKGAILFTVPKKTDIDRCACKEPDLNMYLQKGAGRFIRRRLRAHGIDLNDQSRNRNLAREGSITGNLATLDLSSASDTITIECVRMLLPDDWFSYLDCIRSPAVAVDDTWVSTQMFSSMGNGFTFELESLIFFVLARTCAYFEGIRGVISVYGDDIICPSDLYPHLTWVLKTFGFSVNESKSFHTGPFRESCGGHYHNGEDITPFYLKRPPTHLTDVIRVANQLRWWALRDTFRQYEQPSTYKMWIYLASLVPRSLWGGYDHSVDTQLVAPIAPTHRLSRWTSKKRIPDKNLYLLWHNSTWNRSSGPEEESFGAVDTRKGCSIKRSSGAVRCNLVFHEEIGLHPHSYT